MTILVSASPPVSTRWPLPLIDAVIGMGGVAQKSKLVMQTMADVLEMPIKVSASDQAPALGSAMYASVAAGFHPDLPSAVSAMGAGFDEVYTPREENAAAYKKLYEKYSRFGEYVEGEETHVGLTDRQH